MNPKRSIHRGAFSKVLALPMWVEMGKVSFAEYKRQTVAPAVMKEKAVIGTGPYGSELAVEK